MPSSAARNSAVIFTLRTSWSQMMHLHTLAPRRALPQTVGRILARAAGGIWLSIRRRLKISLFSCRRRSARELSSSIGQSTDQGEFYKFYAAHLNSFQCPGNVVSRSISFGTCLRVRVSVYVCVRFKGKANDYCQYLPKDVDSSTLTRSSNVTAKHDIRKFWWNEERSM